MRYFIIYDKYNKAEGYTTLEREPIDWTGYKEVSDTEYSYILKNTFGEKFNTNSERLSFVENDIADIGGVTAYTLEDISVTAELASYSLEDGATTAEMLVYALEKIEELQQKIKILEEGVV